jgi:moderate conductance mechanosensitive channel
MSGVNLEDFGATTTDQAVNAASDILGRFAENFLNVRSLVVLAVSLTIALLLGRFIAFLLRRLVYYIGSRADKTEDLNTVNRLRRYETVLVLSIAVIRGILVIMALYYWWIFIHPTGQPTALIGASALAVIVVSSAFSPLLRDMAAGSFMMAEHWYGVGDHIRIEPFMDMQGVVERVTLRSTRIRTLNGEIIWISNQNIQGVRLAPKGIRSIGLEIFVTDLEAGRKLIERTNRRLPTGPLLMVNPLQITNEEVVGDNLWHVTAIGETAPGREWLIENSAVDLIKELDEATKKPCIAHGPLARYADYEADRRFSRTIKNARKRPVVRKKHLSASVKKAASKKKPAAK